MATILFLGLAGCRIAKPQMPPGSTAKVLMFTGVRRERLHPGSAFPAARLREPMFDDSAPAKPVRKKRPPRKNG